MDELVVAVLEELWQIEEDRKYDRHEETEGEGLLRHGLLKFKRNLRKMWHSLKRVVPATNLVKFGQIWQLKIIKIIWRVLSLFTFAVNHSK